MIQVAYIAICIILAWFNYRTIAKNKRVFHGLNGIVHIACWGLAYLLSGSVWLTLSLPFIGRTTFDIALNKFRGFSPWYVTLKPKSWMDKVERFFFKTDGRTPKIIWVAIALTLNVIHYARH